MHLQVALHLNTSIYQPEIRRTALGTGAQTRIADLSYDTRINQCVVQAQANTCMTTPPEQKTAVAAAAAVNTVNMLPGHTWQLL